MNTDLFTQTVRDMKDLNCPDLNIYELFLVYKHIDAPFKPTDFDIEYARVRNLFDNLSPQVKLAITLIQTLSSVYEVINAKSLQDISARTICECMLCIDAYKKLNFNVPSSWYQNKNLQTICKELDISMPNVQQDPDIDALIKSYLCNEV